MADLESLATQVWNPEVKPLAEDALRCYNAGVVRACIAATWTAVTADIIMKVTWLADEGDREALDFRDKVRSAQQLGLKPEGVRKMQAIESDLLQLAQKFDLIDSIGYRELQRIREDRNLCAHPSLRAREGMYQPQPEVARGHLAVALSSLLTHPPRQGRLILEDLASYVTDANFVPATTYVQTRFYDHVRTATRGTVATLVAKHAVLEIDDGPSPVKVADRMADVLDALAQRDRELVREAVAKAHKNFHRLSGDAQLRALGRLGDRDYFWSAFDRSLVERLLHLLSTTESVVSEDPLPTHIAVGLSTVRSVHARTGLPGLVERWDALPWADKMTVIESTAPDPYFVSSIPEFMRQAWSYRAAEQAGRLAVNHAPFLDLDDLVAILDEWGQNLQCRRAFQMPQNAAQLFERTTHLGRDRMAVFYRFVSDATESEPDMDGLDYAALRRAVANAH
ncbi:hypothetical protein ACFU44_26855 [Nocardia rhizosphaerihabitans]|uniref:hypothetical protein n=1 Tax=Nocardia rhizosphaerihabitans TaxID=1691570 RepID=UPI0036735D82